MIFVVVIAVFVSFTHWLAKFGTQTGVLGFLNRARSCLAYEGDLT
jgi:hypothetical protein